MAAQGLNENQGLIAFAILANIVLAFLLVPLVGISGLAVSNGQLVPNRMPLQLEHVFLVEHVFLEAGVKLSPALCVPDADGAAAESHRCGLCYELLRTLMCCADSTGCVGWSVPDRCSSCVQPACISAASHAAVGGLWIHRLYPKTSVSHALRTSGFMRSPSSQDQKQDPTLSRLPQLLTALLLATWLP